MLAADVGATLVFYFKDGERQLYIWVVTPQLDASSKRVARLEFHAHKLPSTLEECGINGLVSGFGRGVRGTHGAPEGSATAAVAEMAALEKLHELHSALIGPILELLPPPATAGSAVVSRLVFIPHDELCRVPFPALISAAEEAQPLLVDYEVQVCSSLRVLALTRKNATDELDLVAEALVVGYPLSDLPAVRLPWAPEDISVAKLPGAAAEAAAVAETLCCSALVGPAATREAVLQRLSSAPVVHIATHGFVNEGGDNKTVLLLHDDSGNGSSSTFLSEDELQPATLSLAARLVVLPACHVRSKTGICTHTSKYRSFL